MQIGEKIKTIRELNDLSQEEVAHKLHMSVNGYAKLERGETRLYFDNLERIAAVLNINVIDLLSVNEKAMLCLVNDGVIITQKNQNQNNKDIYQNFSNDKTQVELEKCQLMLEHKNDLVHQQAERIKLLEDLVQSLKNQLAEK